MRHTPRLAFVAAAALVMTACGGGDETPVAADDPPAGEEAAEPADEPTEEPAEPAAGPASADPTAVAPFGVVTAQQGAAIMDFDSVTLIDVRTPAEFAEGHIEGAALVDLNSGDFPGEIGQYDPDGQYLLYCRSGNRSAQAAAIMADLGFGQVWDMGGIIDWQAAGFPVVQ